MNHEYTASARDPIPDDVAGAARDCSFGFFILGDFAV